MKLISIVVINIIFFLHIQNTDCAVDICYKDDLQIFNNKIIYTGHSVNKNGNTSKIECINNCNAMRSMDGVLATKAVILINNCFCLKENVNLKENTSCVVSTGTSCNILTSVCPVGPYKLAELDSEIVSVDFTMSPSVLLPGVKLNFTFSTVPSTIAGVEYILEFGYGLMNITEQETSIKNTIIFTPGYEEWRVRASTSSNSLQVEKTKFVYISENIRGAHFTNHVVLETNKEYVIYFNIAAGTNMTVKITNGNAAEQTFNADVYTGEISEMYGIKNSMMTAYVGAYIVPSLLFDEDGSISQIQYMCVKAGVLNLLVLRPRCNTGESYSPLIRKCTTNETLAGGIDLITARTMSKSSLPTWASPPTIEVVHNIMMVNESACGGLQTVKLESKNLNVNKNDMIGFVQTVTSGKIAFRDDVPRNIFQLSSNTSTEPGKKFALTGIVNGIAKVPILKIHYSKWFNHKSLTKPITPGVHQMTGTVTNPFSSEVVNVIKKYKVQDRITGLEFVDNFPKKADVSAYDLADRMFQMKASVVKGSDVEYMFTVKQLQLQIASTTRGAEFNINETGIYTVEVEASNLINKMNTSREFRILSSIQGLNLTVDKTTIILGNILNIAVNVVNGTNVTLEINYGDESKPYTTMIGSADNGVFRNVTHNFTKCGRHVIKARVRNDITTQEGWEIFKSPYKDKAIISVFCLLYDLKVNTRPVMSSNNDVELMVNTTLNLQIELGTGSFATFVIDWRDGSKDTKDQSDNPIPTSFEKNHIYRTNGTYNVTVTVSNSFGRSIKYFIVNIVECALPRLIFEYGEEDKRLTYFKKDKVSIKATWTISKSNPEGCVSEETMKHNWKLVKIAGNKLGVVDSSGGGFQWEYNRVIYEINNIQEPGDYNVILTVFFGNDTGHGKEYVYTGYFTFSSSSLVAKIQNEQFQSIASRITTNLTFYDFHLNASESHDPDNVMQSTNGIVFRWQCRLISNDSQWNISLTERNNDTSGIPLLCKNHEYESLNRTDSTPKFNTKYFLAKIEYEFKLIITKNDRTSTATQIVLILPGAPPNIDLVCSEKCKNCEEKVNINNLLAFQLAGCSKYQLNTMFHSVWTVRLDSDPGIDVIPPLVATGTCYRHNLIISANTLEASKNYTFTLKFRYANFKDEGIFKVKRRTSETPYDGKCNIKGSKNITVSSSVTVECSGWKTEDGPIEYQFYQTPKPNTKGPLGEKAQQTKFTFKPAAGDDSKDYMNTIGVVVLNRFRQIVEVDLRIYVRPPKVSVNISEILDKLPADNPQEIANAVIMLTTATKPTLPTSEDGDTVNVKKEEFGGITIEKSAEQQEKEQKERKAQEKELTSLADAVFNSIDNNTNIDALAAATNAIEAVSSSPGSSTGSTLDSCTDAIDLISKRAAALFPSSDEGVSNLDQGISREKIDEFTDIMTNALSKSIEVVNNAAKVAEKEVTGTSTTTELQKQEKLKEAKEKHIERTKSVREGVDTLASALAKNQISGEKEKQVKSEKVDLYVMKASSPSALSDTTFNDHQNSSETTSGFVIKNASRLFSNASFGKPVSCVGVTFKTDMFPGILGSENVHSNQPTLTFISEGEQIKIKDAPEPVTVKIKNKPENLKTKNISMYLPGKLVFHSVKLDKPCNLLLNLKRLNDFQNKTTLDVYIQYGQEPSIKDHDIKLTVTRSGNINVTVNSDDVLLNQTKRERNSNVFLAQDKTLVMWDFDNFTYGYKNNSKLYLGLIYEGGMPPLQMKGNPYTYDQLPFRGAYNYSLVAFCTKCSFVDTESGNYSWSDKGCSLQPQNTSLSMSVCECNHLTTFGSFFVSPNPLGTPSFAALKEGFVLLVTVATILLLYIIGLIFTRRADRADTTKIGVSPLPDNKPENKYLYEITINTGSQRNGGTKSNIYFQIGGDLDETGTRILKDTARETFQRSSSDVFVMTTLSSLGQLSYLRIWHDNSGGGWYLRSIEVVDLQTEEKFVFIASRWLSVDQNDGQIGAVFPLAGQLELKDFNYIFSSKARRDFSDAHIWFSIYARPPRSPFTRCQRLSVAISLVFTGMTASCMFYGAIPTGDKASENKIGNFSFTWQQVFVAIVSACITIPVNVILVGLFRSIRPSKLPTTDGENDVTVFSNEAYSGCEDEEEEEEEEGEEYVGMNRKRGFPPSPSNEHLIHGDLEKKNSTHVNVNNDHEDGNTLAVAKNNNTAGKKKKKNRKEMKKKKEPFYLPHWVLYPTWFLCICVILGSAIVVVWYGMAFGNKKSLNWLASISISLVQDILLMQPLKVFFVALFVAMVVKKLDEEERSEVEKQVKSLARDENWLHQFKDGSGNIFDRADSDIFEPLKNDKLHRMKELRMKELKMQAISREIMLYILFACVVFALGFMTRDYRAYHQTLDLEELMNLKSRPTDNQSNPIKISELPFKKTITKDIVWDWIGEGLLPKLYPQKWFNLSESLKNNTEIYEFPGRIYLDDLNSKVITGVRLRQVRVVQNSCTKAKEVRDFTSISCLGEYSSTSELTKDFGHNWSIPQDYTINVNPRDMPWRYQSWSQLNGYPFMAELDTYFGGGYVVELFPKWDNKKILDTLKEKRWLDRQTRAVLIEFSIYNANTNYFDSISIVFEFPPGGGVIHYHSVSTFKLYRYTNEYAFFTILCEVMFILFMLLFTIREVRAMYKERWSYFIEFWNLVELSNIILSILSVFFYFYRSVLAKNLLSRLPTKEPNTFINLQFASYWDLVFTYTVALICFFVTLKFIKLFRFNRRISMLSSTLKRAWYPLMMFGIIFGIVLVSVTISATIIFGKALYGYRDNFKTFSSIISLLLGKFSYHQFDSTNAVLGPFFFFSFNIMVNWIIMNMYISILNDVLAEVQEDVKLQNNDYEMVDYMVNNVKGWIGLQNSSNDEMLQKDWEKSKAEDDLKVERSFSRHSRRRLRLSLRSNASMTPIKTTDDDRNTSLSTTPEYSPSIDSAVLNTDITFLTAHDEDDDMDEKSMKEILDKFIKCVTVINRGYKNQRKKPKNLIEQNTV